MGNVEHHGDLAKGAWDFTSPMETWKVGDLPSTSVGIENMV